MLTCRSRDGDFRLHLARELQALGHHVTYIFLRRQPELTAMADGVTKPFSLTELVRFFAALRLKPGAARPVVFNSTNLAFPGLCTLLRLVSGTRWCFDMHDDLLYDFKGPSRIRAVVAQNLLLSQSDAMVHAATPLKRLFPQSHHLGNGSSMVPHPKIRSDPFATLILASLDNRFDFDFMAQAATRNGHRQFDIWGRVSRDDPAVKADLARLVDAHANIAYHGAYSDDTLPELLARYRVAFAPYKVGTKLTEFIDPLRYYHCLASGTGLVSTAIPQAVAMADQIDVVRRVDDVDAALQHALTRRRRPTRSWRDVAETLVPILAALQARPALGSKAPPSHRTEDGVP